MKRMFKLIFLICIFVIKQEIYSSTTPVVPVGSMVATSLENNRINDKFKELYKLIKKFLKPKLIHKQKIESYYGETKYLYFLYYEMPKGSFHSPITKEIIKKEYPDLKIERIDDDFYTQGKEIEELLSVQFVNKLIELVKTNEFEYKEKE